jgi:hypothetical protein
MLVQQLEIKYPSFQTPRLLQDGRGGQQKAALALLEAKTNLEEQDLWGPNQQAADGQGAFPRNVGWNVRWCS